MTNISENLKRLMDINNVTTEELANHLNLSSNLIKRYETGLSLPLPKTLKKIASFFNVPNEDFYKNKNIFEETFEKVDE